MEDNLLSAEILKIEISHKFPIKICWSPWDACTRQSCMMLPLIQAAQMQGIALDMQIHLQYPHLPFAAAVHMAWRKAPVHPPQQCPPQRSEAQTASQAYGSAGTQQICPAPQWHCLPDWPGWQLPYAPQPLWQLRPRGGHRQRSACCAVDDDLNCTALLLTFRTLLADCLGHQGGLPIYMISYSMISSHRETHTAISRR